MIKHYFTGIVLAVTVFCALGIQAGAQADLDTGIVTVEETLPVEATAQPEPAVTYPELE